MSIAIKSAIAGAFAALLIVAVPQAQADGGRWKHEWKHDRYDDHGWRHRHHRHHRGDRVVVIREPRYVVRERAYVIDEPYYYRSRPSVVIGLPPLVVGF